MTAKQICSRFATPALRGLMLHVSLLSELRCDFLGETAPSLRAEINPAALSMWRSQVWWKPLADTQVERWLLPWIQREREKKPEGCIHQPMPLQGNSQRVSHKHWSVFTTLSAVYEQKEHHVGLKSLCKLNSIHTLMLQSNECKWVHTSNASSISNELTSNFTPSVLVWLSL